MSSTVAVVIVALALSAMGRKPSGGDIGVWILILLFAGAYDIVRITRKT